MSEKHQDPIHCVCTTLRKATRNVTQLYDDAIRPSGLRTTQLHTLNAIGDAGEATVTKLTELLLIDQTTLTRNLAVLERDGLIKQVQKPDGRLKSVRLTRKGEQALQAALPLWAEIQERVTKAISTSTWASMSAELERLARLSIA
jgi:DNA-binding MarR family transcriptional regulator